MRICGSFAIAFALHLPGIATAQSRDFDCTKGKVARPGWQELELLQVTYSKVPSLVGDFSQYSYLAALETGETSSGEMRFLKPGFMQWHYREPQEQLFTVTESTLSLYQVSERQVLIDNFSSVLITDLPLAFIMGIGDITKDFTVKDSCKGMGGVILTLEAKDPTKSGALAGLKLLVDPERSLPIGAEVTDVSGNITAVTLKQVKPGAPLTAADFTVTYPPGTDITDRRARS